MTETFSRSSARSFCQPFRIVLAPPGLGKTTVVKRLNEPFDDTPGKRVALDLDIRGPKGPSQPRPLMDALGYYVRAAVNSGVVVFSFLDYFEWSGIPNVPTLIVIPDDEDVPFIVERIADRDGADSPFVVEARKHYAEWVKRWRIMADRLLDEGRKITIVKPLPGEYLFDTLGRMKHETE